MVQNVWTPTKRRGSIAAEFCTPGPGSCNIPSLIGRESPRFSIRGRHETKSRGLSPSPSDYNTAGITNRGKNISPEIVMAGRFKPKSPFLTPAPSSYNPNNQCMTTSTPRFSFGQKYDVNSTITSPAPNAYAVGSTVCDSSSPKFTMAGRGRDEKNHKQDFPSPCQYESAKHLDSVMPRKPAFSLGNRTSLPSDHTQKPGPGAYTVQHEPVKKCEPKYTFGLKHSPYMGAFKQEKEDNIIVEQKSAGRRTFGEKEVVRISAEGVTCRWIDRGVKYSR